MEAPVRASLLLVLALPWPVGCHGDASVRVAAAASLEDWLPGALRAYAEAHPGARVEATFGGSGALERQIEGDAPVAIFLSASPRELDRLAAEGRVARQLPLAENELVLVAPKEGAASLADLTTPRVRRIAIGQPETVPAGRLARQFLERLGLWKALEPKLVFAEDVVEVRAWVARGEVEAGFVYRTETAGLSPTSLPGPPRTELVAALLRGAPASAGELFEFLLADRSRSQLRAAGFAPPPGPPPLVAHATP